MTGEVQLRTATDADDDVLYRLASELDTWELRSETPPRPVTIERWRALRAQRAAADSGASFVIEVGGAAAGRCSLSPADALAHHSEIAIALVADARGRGYGTAALRLLVDFGFERWNLHRLRLSVIGSNTAARACYRKVGFVEEGVLREQVWVRGRWDDEIVMGLLRSEWAGLST